MRLPDFLIVGAMKSGTTTLHGYLAAHPQVFMSRNKEIMYFSQPLNLAKGQDWYAAHFADAQPGQLCGESSTCYSRWPHYGEVTERIAAALPDVKIIYILRNPADRMYSHYGHLMQGRLIRGEGTIQFERAIEEDAEIADASNYPMQIEQFRRKFPADRIHLCLFEDMTRDPQAVLAGIAVFLGIDAAGFQQQQLSRNESGERLAWNKSDQALRRISDTRFARFFIELVPKPARAKIFGSIRSLLLKLFFDRHYRRRIRSEISPFAPETRARLLRECEPFTAGMEQMLGRQLDAWRH